MSAAFKCLVLLAAAAGSILVADAVFHIDTFRSAELLLGIFGIFWTRLLP
jgi:hypothetical protein